MAYAVADLDELGGEGPGGMVRKVRRALGARAFGLNHFTLPPGVEGREHDHEADGQEEVYFVIRGSGVMRLDDVEVELRPGRLVRVDPATRRVPRAGGDGLELLTIGAPVEGRYEPPDWG
jgi:mannose-6-phosphate isomerase-like protein (cupin superfamily)